MRKVKYNCQPRPRASCLCAIITLIFRFF